MSGHGANPIVFNKKKLPPTSDNISFLPYPTPNPLPQSESHTCITTDLIDSF